VRRSVTPSSRGCWSSPRKQLPATRTIVHRAWPCRFDTPTGYMKRASDPRFRRSEALSHTWWQVKDSNLRNFRDGFTVPRLQDRDQRKRLTRNDFRAYSPQIADDHRLQPDTPMGNVYDYDGRVLYLNRLPRRRDQKQLVRLQRWETLSTGPHSTTNGSTGVIWKKRPSSSCLDGPPKSANGHRISKTPRPACFVPTLLGRCHTQ
jgi:hypothetical protein